MTILINAEFDLCDHLNPGFGYQLKISNATNGTRLLFTSKHPVTGDDLLTARDCLDVIEAYVPPRKNKPNK